MAIYPRHRAIQMHHHQNIDSGGRDDPPMELPGSRPLGGKMGAAARFHQKKAPYKDFFPGRVRFWLDRSP